MVITSLKYRIAFTILGLETIMMASVLWITLSNSLEASRQQLAATDQVTSDLLEDLSRIALLTEEFAEIQPHLEKAQLGSHVAQVILANEESKIVASSQPIRIGSPFHLGEDSEENYWRQIEISSSNERIGFLSIQFSNSGINDAYASALRLGITIAAIGMSIIAITGLFIGVLLTLRLDKLKRAAQSMAKGFMDTRTHLHGADEIGKLGEAFDQMAQRIDDNITTIRKKEEQLQAILDNSTAVIYLKDIEGRYILVNRQFEKLLNRTIGQIKGLTDYDIFPKPTADLFRSNDQKVLKTTTPLQVEETVPYSDGEHIYISIKFCLFDGGHVPYGVCGISTDITERKRAEDVLRESEKRYRILVEHAPEAIVTMDVQTGRFVDANENAVRLLGRSREDLYRIGPMDIRATMGPDNQESKNHIDEMIQQALAGATPRYEWNILNSHGDKIQCEIRLVRLPHKGRDLIRASIIDISEQKKSEEELRRVMTEVENLKNRIEAEKIYLQDEIKVEHNYEEIIGGSPIFKKILHRLEKVASTDSTVLILGETGTGKELIARAIHKFSPRHDRTLVKVNCASFAESLIESELFGHEKGAFTGAVSRTVGRFELADGGTIFLDEIGDLPLGLQAKLLRVIQEGEFERIGNPKTHKVNVRVIAATNRNLDLAVKNGSFRNDLYFRLNVFPIKVPPLRERKEDIPVLVKHFVSKYAGKLGKPIEKISMESMAILRAYDWPGNIRELENFIQRAIILTEGSTLQLEEELELRPSEPIHPGKSHTLKENEQFLIQKALEDSHWTIEGKQGAAARLDIPASTLRDRMQKYGLQKPARRS